MEEKVGTGNTAHQHKNHLETPTSCAWSTKQLTYTEMAASWLYVNTDFLQLAA